MGNQPDESVSSAIARLGAELSQCNPPEQINTFKRLALTRIYKSFKFVSR